MRKTKFFLTALSFTIATKTFAAPRMDYRAYVRNLPTEYMFFHEAIDRQYEIKLKIIIADYLDPSTAITYIDEKSPIEFYERARLAPGSFIDVAGRHLDLTCLWLNGQQNPAEHGGDIFLRRVYFVIDNPDCTGPVTELAEDRWESFLQLNIFNPTVPKLKDGALVLNGSVLSVQLTPLDWHSVQLSQ
jgi:hypothetical protein